MSTINITKHDPKLLKSNPWNPNSVDPTNEEKIENSIQELGFFRPVIARELEDGSLQILGGQHRTAAAIRVGLDEVPVVNLGRISDERAKKVGLVDNARYGEDDLDKLADVFRDLGTPEDIMSIMPVDDFDFENIFGKSDSELDFSDLDLGDEDDEADGAEYDTSSPATKSHQIMRFKVPVEDAPDIQEFIKRIQRINGFTESDELTNAGDALVYALGSHPDFDQE